MAGTYSIAVDCGYHVDGRRVRGFREMKNSIEQYTYGLAYVDDQTPAMLGVSLRHIRDEITSRGLYATVWTNYGFASHDILGEGDWRVRIDVYINIYKSEFDQGTQSKYQMTLHIDDVNPCEVGGDVLAIRRMIERRAVRSMCREEWKQQYDSLREDEEPIADGIIRLIQSIKHKDVLDRISDALHEHNKMCDDGRFQEMRRYIEEQAKTRFDILAD